MLDNDDDNSIHDEDNEQERNAILDIKHYQVNKSLNDTVDK